jgi:hypothetical protein
MIPIFAINSDRKLRTHTGEADVPRLAEQFRESQQVSFLQPCARRLESPGFRRIDFISHLNQVHVFARMSQPTSLPRSKAGLPRPIQPAGRSLSVQNAGEFVER